MGSYSVTNIKKSIPINKKIGNKDSVPEEKEKESDAVADPFGAVLWEQR